jgi:hypothetical protein
LKGVFAGMSGNDDMLSRQALKEWQVDNIGMGGIVGSQKSIRVRHYKLALRARKALLVAL